MNYTILDCTLRDGGYYTEWDFDQKLVSTYLQSINLLPIEYIEIGYRSEALEGYLGEYFYLPTHVMRRIKSESDKKLVIILNEKDVRSEQAEKLLSPCVGLIDMVRVAIAPKNFARAIELAKAIKSMGFKVGFNVMYMSTWKEQSDFLDLLPQIQGIVNYFYMVDSYGGVYPEDVREIYNLIKPKLNNISIGFHGHNNLELALINTLTAIECGAGIVDATITGMGRGAGNLKTELLLTALNAKEGLSFDFNALSKVTEGFSKLQKQHEWGTNLPYMVSGANSLPQKEVMSWVSKRFYSFNSIIRTLTNKAKGQKDNHKLESLPQFDAITEVLLVGGGPSVQHHKESILQYLKMNPETAIIHASSRNVKFFTGISNLQIHCLAGNEGYRLEEVFSKIDNNNRMAVLPPYPRKMGTYIPSELASKSYELSEISFTNQFVESITSVMLETAIHLKADTFIVIGYDGYQGEITKLQLELFQENEWLFHRFKSLMGTKITTLTASTYQELDAKSIYALV